jgi:hypothetical protein
MLARAYLNAVVAHDVDAAGKLAGDGYCREWIEMRARDDIAQYGNDEIRLLHSIVIPNPGSSDTIEYGRLDFEYRPKDGQGDWRRATIDVQTDYSPPGFRYLCGGG